MAASLCHHAESTVSSFAEWTLWTDPIQTSTGLTSDSVLPIRATPDDSDDDTPPVLTVRSRCFGGPRSATFKPSHQSPTSLSLQQRIKSFALSKILPKDDRSQGYFPYKYTLALLIATAERKQERALGCLLQGYESSMRHAGTVQTLVNALDLRPQLVIIARQLNVSLEQPLADDEVQICGTIVLIVGSEALSDEILCLRGEKAQDVLDFIHRMLDIGALAISDDRASARITRSALALMVRLSLACGRIPACLVVNGVVVQHMDPVDGGGSADIYRGQYKGITVAVKRLRTKRMPHTSAKKIYREALLWQRVQHPHILPFIGVDASTFEPDVCLVSPWMANGSVICYIKERGITSLFQYVKDIAAGLAYLHSLTIIHGDIRGANILVDAHGKIRIGDFGLAVLAGATDADSCGGTARWMAPELFDWNSHTSTRPQRTPAIDVYSFACTCLEIYSGQPPFFWIQNVWAVIQMVIQGERPNLNSEHIHTISQTLRQLVEDCWCHDPSGRPAMSDVYQRLAAMHF